MAVISNHFVLTALQDSVTINGSIRSTASLSQNYNSTKDMCVPDWKVAENQPTLFAVLQKSSEYLRSSKLIQQEWYYNDQLISFDSNNKSTVKGADGNPLFQKLTNFYVQLGGSNVTVPAIKIINNLAGSNNADLDTLMFNGGIEVSGHLTSFTSTVTIQIAPMSTLGYVGVVTPSSAVITTKGESVVLSCKLYNENGDEVGFYPRWYKEGYSDPFSTERSVTIKETDVTDNMIVRCEFYESKQDADSGNSCLAVAFASIDDMQDPEVMYISYDGKNKDFSGMLHPGEEVTVKAWVATANDPNDVNKRYNKFELSLYDGNNQPVTSNVPAVTISQGKASVTITHNFIESIGNMLTGIVRASEA